MTTRALRLALCSAQNTWGGGEQFLLSLGAGLIAKGHEVHWFAPVRSELKSKLVELGHPVQAFPSRKPRPSDLWELRQNFARLGIQLFHANDPHALNWGSLALLGLSNIRRISVKHTTFPVRKAMKYNWLTDVVACVSNAVQQQCIKDGVWASKTRVIYAGCEVPECSPDEARTFVRQELGIPNDTPVFTAVGNLFECKAYDRLIEATLILKGRLPDFRIAICGEGPERDKLQSLIRKFELSDQVKLLGFRSDANRWIAGSDALVHPSLSEGLSLVAIQAQMLSVPVVAAKIGGLAEVLTAPGTANSTHRASDTSGPDLGWVIHDATPNSLAESILATLDRTTERAQRIEKAREHALARFDVTQMADNFERVYSKLCSKTGVIFQKIPSPSVA